MDALDAAFRKNIVEGPEALRDSIRKNIAEGLSRDDIEEMIQKALAKGRGDIGLPPLPNALDPVADQVREMVDEEYQRAAKGPPVRDWIITDNNIPTGTPKGKPQDLTVETYMQAIRSIFTVTRIETGSRRRDAIALWRTLQDARVFHFDADVYGALHHEADRWTTELAGLEWQHPDSSRKKTTIEDAGRLRATVLDASKKLAPYPDKFPFPAIFIGFGAGIPLPAYMLAIRAPSDLKNRMVSGRMGGHIMTEDGYAAAVIQGVARSDDGSSLVNVWWFDALRDESGGWVRSETNLEPWILPGLVNIVNEHRTFILETVMSPQMRQRFKQERKAMGLPNNKRHTPPPYYTLRMRTQLIREKVRKGLPGPALLRSYRTDRRAHERCRIARGPFPLDPELGAKFNKRGYKLFTVNQLDAETLRRLQERGLPFKRADEWLAILTTWVEKSLTSNDPNLPYIPAVRLPGKVRTRRPQPTNSWADDPR